MVDKLDNSSEESLRRVRPLLLQQQHDDNSKTDRNNNGILIDGEERLIFRQCGIRDKDGIELILQEFPDVSSCIHFAGLKAVGESVSNPLLYFHCNIAGTIMLLQLLRNTISKTLSFHPLPLLMGNPRYYPS